MDSKVDMNYSFLSEEEPTDEQLEQIMRGVQEKVLRENEELKKIMQENMKRAMEEVMFRRNNDWK